MSLGDISLPDLTSTDYTQPDINNVKTVFDPLTCAKRGWFTVTRDKDPVNLYYELHGSQSPDAHKLLFIMGLNNSAFGWFKQVAHFGNLDKNYSVLVFDNRGVGQSDAPKGRYTTSQMAKDTIDLIDFIGWKDERSVNCIGVSMGGMIAQQLALLIPQRLKSLLLTSTKSGNGLDLPTRSSINLFTRLLTGTAGKTPKDLAGLVINSLFPGNWLEEDDVESPGEGRKNRDRVENEFLQRAQITKLQTIRGKMGQTAAVLTHKTTPSQLLTISKTIPKVGIIVGDLDGLINYNRSLELNKYLPGSTLEVVKGAGHALPSQVAGLYNKWIEENVSAAP